MVSMRSPERDLYLAQVLEQVRARLAELRIDAEVTGRPKHLWSIYEKMVVKGREFDDIFDLVGIRVHRRLGEGLLRRARVDPRHLEAGAGPVQGLRGHAQVQPLPVAAHDGDRAAGQAARGADPHRRDAPPRRVRRGRALGLQGRRAPTRRPGLAEPHRRLAAGDVGPRRVHGEPEGRPRAGRGLRLHAQGQGHHPGRAAPRPSTSPTRSTPRSATPASAPGSTAGWCRSTTSSSSGDTVRDLHVEGRGRRARRRDWLQIVATPRAAQQDPPVVLPGAPRGRRRDRPRRAGQGAAPRGPARAEAGHGPVLARGGRRRSTTPTSTRSTPPIGEHHVSAESVAGRDGRKVLRGGDPSSEDAAAPPPSASPAAPARRSARPRASTSRASTTSWCACRAAARRCPATRSSASSPAAAACRSTAPTAPTPARWPAGQGDRLIEVEWDERTGGTFVASIEVQGPRPRPPAARRVAASMADHHVNILQLPPRTPAPTASPRCASSSSWPTRPPRQPSSPPSAASTASTTPTGSSPAKAGSA